MCGIGYRRRFLFSLPTRVALRRHYAKLSAACRRSGLIFAFGFRSSIFASAPKKLRVGMIFHVPPGVFKCIFVDNVSFVQKAFAPNVKIMFVFHVGVRHSPKPKRSLIYQSMNDFLAGSSMLKPLQLNGRCFRRELPARRSFMRWWIRLLFGSGKCRMPTLKTKIIFTSGAKAFWTKDTLSTKIHLSTPSGTWKIIPARNFLGVGAKIEHQKPRADITSARRLRCLVLRKLGQQYFSVLRLNCRKIRMND